MLNTPYHKTVLQFKTMIMKYNLFLAIFFICVNCASKKNTVYYEKIPENLKNNANRFDLDKIVYLVRKEILYKCRIEHNSKDLDVKLKYIKMTILGTT